MSDNREIRVFISSTFRDMQKERELLVKQVFPELRRVCDERFVSFTEVDLRWGITKEQQAEGKVLPICLEEIHTCRPYFIGILGERYGWIPNIQEHVGQRTSVTELEILHGVLRNKGMAGHAFFYFRDPAFIETLAAKEQIGMVEREIPDDINEFGSAEAARHTQHRKDKLAALKETIRKNHLPLVDPYANPDTLAATVRQQFLDLIDTLYPKEQVPNPLDQEAIGHRTYARRKLLACIDRPTHLAALDAFTDAPPDGHGLVVTGDSGGGKTALLAAWVSRYRQAHPDHFVLEHFFGATSESASVPQFLHRLLGELKRLANVPDEIPSAPEKMAEALPLWLAQSIGKVPRIVLVLDALNQIEGEPSHRNLSWLPVFFPAYVRVIASSLSGPALETLRVRSWTEHPLPLANVDERGRMVDAFLHQYRKKLGPTLRNVIVNAPGAANPLFLRTVLEELRQFGDFGHLPDKVRDYLQATTPVDLFRQVIWQEDFHVERDIVNRSLCFLWTTRQGLSESKWLDLLADDQGPMDRQTWRPLFLAMATHLVLHSDLWTLGHDYLKHAIQIELLPTEDAKKHAHLAVADYFEKHPNQREMTARKAAEWPHQLHAAEAWERLEACLTDISLFLALYNEKTMWELTGYWHPLRRMGRNMGCCYDEAYKRWIAVPANAGDHYVSAQLGSFLSENDQDRAAESLLKRALEVRKRVLGSEHPDTLQSVTKLAGLLASEAGDADLEGLFRRVLEVQERVLGPEHPTTLGSMNNLARFLLGKKRGHVLAEPLLRRVLEVRERVLGPGHPDTLESLRSLGSGLSRKGDYRGTEQLYRRALEGFGRVLGPEHSATLGCMNNLAELLKVKGDYRAAELLYRLALEGHDRVFGPEHPRALGFVNNLALLLIKQHEYASAELLYRRALESLLKISLANPERDKLVLEACISMYARCLSKRGLNRQKITDQIEELVFRHAPSLSLPNLPGYIELGTINRVGSFGCAVHLILWGALWWWLGFWKALAVMILLVLMYSAPSMVRLRRRK